MIVGGGFAGLWAIRTLAHVPADVVLVDDHNYHSFLPLLYQVAAAELEPEAIAFPFRAILRHLPHARFVQARVTEVDLAARQVHTSGPTLAYDYLIVATGSASQFFGVAGAADHAFVLKGIDDGMALRNHILTRFELAEQLPPGNARQQALTFAVVGGGPTGVEFSGALMELIRGPLMKDYASLHRDDIRVLLMEATDSLLPGMPPDLQRYVAQRLRRMGVEVRLKSPVGQVSADGLLLSDATFLPTQTVVWTAGVRGDPLARAWGLPTGRSGRVSTRPTLQVAGYPEVFVAGDLADPQAPGGPLPMTAPVATQQGVWAARNIARQMTGRLPLPFRFCDRGTMVTIGRNAAVADLRLAHFSGYPAWLLWLSIHLYNLIGIRQRLLVLLAWAWDYLFSERVVRLILPSQATQLQPVREHKSPTAAETLIAKSEAIQRLTGHGQRQH